MSNDKRDSNDINGSDAINHNGGVPMTKTIKTPAEKWAEYKAANPDTPMDKLTNALAGLHVYNCGSEGARGDLAKDYDLPAYPDAATDLSYKKEPFTAEEQKLWDETSKISDDLADAECEHMMGASAEMARCVIDVYRTSECAYCGESHTDPDQVYGHNYDFALMALFEAVASEIVERSTTHEHALFSNPDLVKSIAAIGKEGA